MNKSRVAEYYGVDLDAIVGIRKVNEGADYRVLINYGIGGVKVYIVPVETFTPAPPTVSIPAAYDLNSELSYKELQELAKEKGIPANQSAAVLRAALEEEE